MGPACCVFKSNKFFFFPQFFSIRKRTVRFRERDKIEKCTIHHIYICIYNWSWNTIGRANVERKQTMVIKQANTNIRIVRVRVVSRGGEREN